MPEEKVKKTFHEFLRQNPVTNITEEVYISNRFKEAGLKFTIKPVSGDQFAEYKNMVNQIGRHGKVKFNQKLFHELMAINHTIEPNFRDSDAIKAAGCTTAEQYLYQSLHPGEIENLVQQISALSGFDQDEESLKEEAKN
jgi:hypothetical protein